MSTPDGFLWIYEDRARGLALIRGLNVKKVLELAVVLDRARYSTSGRGWVLPIDTIADIAAMADYSSTPYRVKQIQHANETGEVAAP